MAAVDQWLAANAGRFEFRVLPGCGGGAAAAAAVPSPVTGIGVSAVAGPSGELDLVTARRRRHRLACGAGRAAATPAGPRSVASPPPILTPRRGAGTASTSSCEVPTGRCGIAPASSAGGRSGPPSAVRRSGRRPSSPRSPAASTCSYAGRTTPSTRSGGPAASGTAGSRSAAASRSHPTPSRTDPASSTCTPAARTAPCGRPGRAGRVARVGTDRRDPHVVARCGDARPGTGRRVRQGRRRCAVAHGVGLQRRLVRLGHRRRPAEQRTRCGVARPQLARRVHARRGRPDLADDLGRGVAGSAPTMLA